MPPPNFGAALPQIRAAFFATSALDTAYLRNETSHRQTKMPLSIYNVSSKTWPTFRDLWPRNGWDPFRHCDPPFGGHYVATIMSSCYFFIGKSLDWQRIFVNVTRLVHIWRWLALLTGRLYTIRRCQASNCWPVWTVRFTFTACHNVTFEWSWNWTVIKIWPVVGRVGNW